MNTPLRGRLSVGFALTIIALCTLWPVLGCDFVGYDDWDYVTQNRAVQQGLTFASLRWACTATTSANWHPLTWISHMLDWQLYGPAPLGHHLTSLLLHLANTLLLFFLLDVMTRSLWPSAFVAALFAIHPLHVESVAWVAERKDVLCTLLWLLTTWAYFRYVKTPGMGRYLLVVMLYSIGLTAKPMLVTLPFTLLLLDYWPLGRWTEAPAHPGPVKVPWLPLWEKLPLFALAAASSVVTFLVQRSGEAVGSFEGYPPAVRVSNAFVSYVTYLGQTFWPRGLAIYYPHLGERLPAAKVATAALLLILVTALAIWTRHRRPYLLVGWLWYLGTLVPVIGLVQVGGQARADRYTYVPLIGIFVALAWGVPDLLRTVGWIRHPRPATGRGVLMATLPVAVVVLALASVSRMQAGTWRNSVTLFEHALAVTESNVTAHNALGVALAEEGRMQEAIRHYEDALRIKSDYVKTHNNLGAALVLVGRAREGIDHFETVLRLDPNHAEAHYNLGLALAAERRLPEAIHHFETALRLRPSYAEAHFNLGKALYLRGDYSGAWREVHLAQRHGYNAAPRFLEMLSAKMAESVRP